MKKWLTIFIFLSFAACGDEDGTRPPVNINNANDVNNSNSVNNVNNSNNATNSNNANNVNNVGSDMGSSDMGSQIDMSAGVDMMTGQDMGMAEEDMGSNPPDMTMMTATDPFAAGSLNAQTDTTTVTADGESIPLSIFLPTGMGPYPVVVFHHGFQLDPSDYTSYGNHLASHGYVVVMPEMPGSAFNPTPHARLSRILLGVVDWIEDDIMNGSVIGAKGDASLLGLAGHSLGGKVSLLSAANDARPDAVFGIDPVDSAPPFSSAGPDYPSVTPERMGDISVPIVLLGETVDSAGGFMNCAPADQNFQQYYSAATSPALEIELVGADHMDFLDNPNCGFVCSSCGPGSADPVKVKEYTRGYLVAFFDLHLKGMSEQATWLTGPEMAADEATNEVAAQSKNSF